MPTRVVSSGRLEPRSVRQVRCATVPVLVGARRAVVLIKTAQVDVCVTCKSRSDSRFPCWMTVRRGVISGAGWGAT